MERFTEFMQRKVFGIPAGVFVLIGAAVILFFAIRMKNTATVAEVSGETISDPPGGDGSGYDDTQYGGFVAGTSGVYQPSGATSTGASVTAVAGQDTNVMWGVRVRNWLTANGASVDMSSAVVSKYLNGEGLTVEEAKWRDKAIGQFGYPPEEVGYAGIIPGTVTGGPDDTPGPGTDPTPDAGGDGGVFTPDPVVIPDAPAEKQGTSFPVRHSVRGPNDNTPGKLSRLYYGDASGAHTDRILNKNPGLNFPYHVGDVVYVPNPEAVGGGNGGGNGGGTPGTTPTPGTTNPAPPSGPAVKQGVPPLVHKVQGTNDDQDGELSRLYYGDATTAHTALIRSKNLNKEMPYRVGDGVNIPEDIKPEYFTATANYRSANEIAQRTNVDVAKIRALNPNKTFPVPVGTVVRIH